MIEFNQVTTRGGDRGESSLFDGSRLRKDDLLFETMGDLDELNSFLGVAAAALRMEGPREYAEIAESIEQLQRFLFRVGAMIATPRTSSRYQGLQTISTADVEALEKLEHAYLEKTTVSSEFVLPGKTLCGAHLDVARTVCRRCERRIVTCIRDRSMPQLASCQNYLNRLSDLLFILARHVQEL